MSSRGERFVRLKGFDERGWLAPILLTVAVLFSSQSQVNAQSVTAIVNGTVLTMAGESIPKGTVLIRDGKIAAVGSALDVPENAEVHDADGKWVLPGIIDAMSYFGIRPDDRNDSSKPVSPENRILTAYAPFSDFMGGRDGTDRRTELLSGGITTIYIAPGNKQVIGGQGAVVKMQAGWSDAVVVREPASIDITLGDPPRIVFGAKGKSPSTRMSVAGLIREALVKAQDFQRAQKRSQENPQEEAGPETPKRDLSSEALLRLLAKEVPARIEANLADDIRTAMRIADEFDLDIVIDGGMGAYEMKDALAERNIPVVLGPISHTYMEEVSGGRTLELFTKVNENNAALLTEAGVKIAFASFGYSSGYLGSSYQGRWLLLEAALATGFGLAEEEALKAITINPAQILGVEDRIGSLETGKDADVIILDGPPLNPKTWVEKTFINGTLVYDKRGFRP